jgi:hydroxyacylglutathione hydrolase
MAILRVLKLAVLASGWLTVSMNLEDNLGDIIRKGRKAANVSAEAAAKAAGITEAELASMEESGKVAGKPDFIALAKLTGQSGTKMESIAKGWLPSKKDLSIWQQLRMYSTEGEGMVVNNYLVWDEMSREAAIFDTGWSSKQAIDEIEKNELQLRHIFITHSHDDHIADLKTLREKFPKAHLHSNSKNAPPQQRYRANEFIHLGSLRITNRDTPGHAEDGVTYVIGTWPDDAPHVAIVGDAIFAGSIGSGLISWDIAKQKVREQIFSLPPDTLICSGHGPLTTVGEEKEHNPFFP